MRTSTGSRTTHPDFRLIPISSQPVTTKRHFRRPSDEKAFTLFEVLVMAGIVGLLVSIMGAGLSHTSMQGKAVRCINNQRQLITGWRMYAADNSEKVIYNLGEVQTEIANGTYRNWANNILSWDLNGMNTNLALLRSGILAPYLGTNVSAYRCPAYNYLSAAQMSARFTARTRSVSMNAFFGPYTLTTPSGQNTFFPTYRQWLRVSEVLRPAMAWVVIEEHPDSINDGYFINSPVGTTSWTDIPGSLHNGGCTLAFADSHVEVHHWLSKSSKLPVRFTYTAPTLDPLGRIDVQWLGSRTAVLYR